LKSKSEGGHPQVGEASIGSIRGVSANRGGERTTRRKPKRTLWQDIVNKKSLGGSRVAGKRMHRVKRGGVAGIAAGPSEEAAVQDAQQNEILTQRKEIVGCPHKADRPPQS